MITAKEALRMAKPAEIEAQEALIAVLCSSCTKI